MAKCYPRSNASRFYSCRCNNAKYTFAKDSIQMCARSSTQNECHLGKDKIYLTCVNKKNCKVFLSIFVKNPIRIEKTGQRTFDFMPDVTVDMLMNVSRLGSLWINSNHISIVIIIQLWLYYNFIYNFNFDCNKRSANKVKIRKRKHWSDWAYSE